MTLTETCNHFSNIAKTKALNARQAPGALFGGAMLGGAFVGIALILALTCIAGLPVGVRPLVSGAVFGIGLILVVMSGGEMFTGHVMYETFGVAKGEISLIDALRLFAIVWLGNLAGALILSFLASTAGGVIFSTGTFLHDLVAKKESAPIGPLFCKAILCNWLVCLAIWLAARLKSETAKMIGMAWCLLAFVACGFEHCVANMTALSLGMFAAHSISDLPGVAYNLSVVTAGNFVGGAVFVAGAYLWTARGERPSASGWTAIAPSASHPGPATSQPIVV